MKRTVAFQIEANMKTKTDLIRLLVNKEGKKQQINIAQMSEIVKILSDEMKKDSRIIAVLLKED